MTFDELLKIAVSRDASDLHLAVGKPPILRIDGNLMEMEETPILTAKQNEDLIYDIISSESKEYFLKNKELDISYEIKDLARFRINLCREKGNISLSARVIPLKLPTMEELKMPQVIYDLIKSNQGLILVTGPSGCGKSTTLAAMINQINNEQNRKIITLEDPVEFFFPSQKSVIVQRELGGDMFSFNEALRRALRQDPNIIMVGEMRDFETIATTITLAETGHLVLATLHTSNSSQTIDRIIDIFPPHQQPQVRAQLSMSLKCVISQQLLPKIGGGRIAAREIMINIPAVANLIRENKISQIRNVIHTGTRYGMITLDQDLKRLYCEKSIAKETAESYMENIGLLE